MGQPSITTANGIIHDFYQQLQFSEQASHEPFWDAVYRKAFPNLVNHMVCTGNTASQKSGIDRLIHLSNGKTLTVDEKKRAKVYGDILLEFISIDRTRAPGWIAKDLTIDYLAYAFMPIKVCYLFPWLLLRRAWLQFGEAWKVKYPLVSANNDSYKTLSVAVPITVVQKAVQTAAIIDVSEELRNWIPEQVEHV